MLHVADTKALEDKAFVMLPLMSVKASAGGGLVAEAEAVDAFVAFQAAYLRALGINPRFARILLVAGDSMQPTLADQDQVIVDTSIDHVVDDALYAVVYGGAVLVKRVQLQFDGSVFLQSDNKAAGYRDQVIAVSDLHELHVVGRVRAHLRNI